MSAHRVSIEVDGGVIVCKDKGGNVHAHRRDQIDWVGKRVQFTLTFADLDSGATVWPFVGAQPQWPRAEFSGTLIDAGVPVYYKYSVAVSGCQSLDPIIIVDK